MPKKKSKTKTLTARRHVCWQWCGERLLGIVENEKVLGQVAADAEFDIRSAIGPVYVPAGAVELRCQHGRTYILAKKG